MTDFVDDLEAELLAAARRRTTRRRRGRSRAGSRLGLLLAASAAAAAVVAVAIAVLADRPARVAVPPAGASGRSLVLPVPGSLSGCDGEPLLRSPGKRPKLPVGTPQAELTGMLGVLRRAATHADRLPEQNGWSFSAWMPLGDHDPKATRIARTRVGTFSLLPTGDLRERPLACGDSPGRGAGVCLTGGGMQQWQCFTAGQIRAGEAVGLLDVTQSYARVVAVVPDGVRRVRVRVAKQTRTLPVRDNVVVKYFRFVEPGDRVEVELLRTR